MEVIVLISISLCMIVKNEEDTLSNCLESVKDIVDEIVIVDTGSTDNTKEIAQKYTDKIFDFKWIDNFASARNYSFSKATKDYILWLDADDILLNEDRKKFKVLKQILKNNADSISMIYNYAFDKNGAVLLNFKRNRLIKRDKNFKWIGAIHEYINVQGRIIDSDIHITHKRTHSSPGRNLKIFEKMISKEIKFTPRDTYYYANELYDNKYYHKALEYYNKFLCMNDGWYENKINACHKISKYYNSIDNKEKSREYCYKSFEYDKPRAEFCCMLGLCFIQQNKWNEAVFWYELALNLKRPEDSWGFFDNSCWTWLPHLQLCVCYDKLGNHKLAYEHNEMAAKYVPNNTCILHNEEYFEKLGFK
ncbi:glycosyltransferase [Haloimpatiens sp. FM7330]|uniref:glycosyltransferase n=1 Tax=Haloimpatiens sp. FM7330 TaxID=3298610 RepID=UPI00362DF945